jgi:hypothetical protein
VKAKYKTLYSKKLIIAKALYNNNKDNYLVHLQEELMDASLYIQKLLDLKEELTIMVKMHPSDAELGMVIRKFVS